MQTHSLLKYKDGIEDCPNLKFEIDDIMEGTVKKKVSKSKTSIF